MVLEFFLCYSNLYRLGSCFICVHNYVTWKLFMHHFIDFYASLIISSKSCSWHWLVFAVKQHIGQFIPVHIAFNTLNFIDKIIFSPQASFKYKDTVREMSLYTFMFALVTSCLLLMLIKVKNCIISSTTLVCSYQIKFRGIKSLLMLC